MLAIIHLINSLRYLLRGHAVGCHVGEATASEVDVWRVVLLCLLGDLLSKVRFHGKLLVPRPLEEITEAAGRAHPRNFRVEVYRSSYTGDVGTGSLAEFSQDLTRLEETYTYREDGVELRSVATRGDARSTDTFVTG